MQASDAWTIPDGSGRQYYSLSDSDPRRLKHPAVSQQMTLVRLRAFSDQYEIPSYRNEVNLRSARVGIDAPGLARIVALRETVSVPADDYSELSERIRNDAAEAVSNYLAIRIEEPFWAWKAGRWTTTDPARFGAYAEAAGVLRDSVKKSLIGDPIGIIGSKIGLGDISLVEGIAEQIPIPGIDKTLGEVKLYIEVAGIIFGVLTGNPFLVCASSKLMVHDGLRRAAAGVIRDVIRDLGNTPAKQQERTALRGPADRLDILSRSVESPIGHDQLSNFRPRTLRPPGAAPPTGRPTSATRAHPPRTSAPPGAAPPDRRR